MKKKRIEIVVLVLAITSLIAVGIVIFLQGFVLKTEFKKEEFTSSDPPNVESLNLTAPGDDAESKIDFAVNLYDIACENWKNLDNAAMHIKSENEMMGAMVIGYRYCVKNLEEYYYLEYSHIPEGGNPFMEQIIGLFSASSTKFALGKYTDSSMEQVYGRRTIKPVPKVKLDEETNQNVYFADWTECEEEIEEKFVFNKNQSGKYFQTEVVITKDTILTANIKRVEPKTHYEKDEEKIPMGYWEIVLELDPAEDKAAAIVLPRLREGAGNKAYYSKFVETMQIWDNGYFKYFKAEDTWGGGTMGAGTTLLFETYFKYDEYSCDPNNYQYMLETKEAALAAKKDGRVD